MDFMISFEDIINIIEEHPGVTVATIVAMLFGGGILAYRNLGSKSSQQFENKSPSVDDQTVLLDTGAKEESDKYDDSIKNESDQNVILDEDNSDEKNSFSECKIIESSSTDDVNTKSGGVAQISEASSGSQIEIDDVKKEDVADDSDDDGWILVGKSKKSAKKPAKKSKEYDNIKELYSYQGHERDEESINLVYKRYTMYSKCGWDRDKINTILGKKCNDLKLGDEYYNLSEPYLPELETGKKYLEFYVLSGNANELDNSSRPGTPRFIISSDIPNPTSVYFSNHYNDYIDLKTGKKYQNKRKDY